VASNTDTGDFVRMCLFAALIAALGLLPKFDLPFLAGVPVTAQTLGVMLAGVVLGARNGALAVSLLIFIVALGMPLLAGGRGGLGIFFGPSGGFLLGWIPGAWLAGFAMSRFPVGSVPLRAFTASIAGGICAVYALGIPWLAFVAGLSLPAAALVAVVFVPGDVIKAIIVAVLVSALPVSQLQAGR